MSKHPYRDGESCQHNAESSTATVAPLVRHVLKCWPTEYVAMVNGTKTAEFRFNDRGYKVGDLLLEREWDHRHLKYTGREALFVVTHVVEGEWGIPAGYCMMSVVRVQAEAESSAPCATGPTPEHETSGARTLEPKE
jgi:hypothetical protein